MLSEEQKGEVAKWFAAGTGLAEIQKRISDEFGIDMTYLDVRLMVADMPQPAEPAAQDSGDAPAPAPGGYDDDSIGDTPAGYDDAPVPGRYEDGAPAPGSYDDDAIDSPINGSRPDASSFETTQSETAQSESTQPDPDSQEAPPLAELSVSVDPLAPPGVIACGSVVFSDGTSGKWMLDQMGRLGLSGLPEGYRPSPEDGAQFQPKLLAALRAKGLV